MILYRNQLLYQNSKSRPLIFLGFDKTQDNKIWAVVINNGKPIIDWFMLSGIDYIRGESKIEKATPGSKVIFYGKYKGKDINEVFEEKSVDKETVDKFGEYLEFLAKKQETK